MRFAWIPERNNRPSEIIHGNGVTQTGQCYIWTGQCYMDWPVLYGLVSAIWTGQCHMDWPVLCELVSVIWTCQNCDHTIFDVRKSRNQTSSHTWKGLSVWWLQMATSIFLGFWMGRVTDGRVIRAGVSVTWNVLSWSEGHEFELQLGQTWGA